MFVLGSVCMEVKVSENEKQKLIMKYLKYDDYQKGRRYYPGYIGKGTIRYNRENPNLIRLDVPVESERTSRIYDCELYINKDTNEILNLNCDCPQFRETKSCKHLAASIYFYYEQIFRVKLSDKERANYTKELFKKILGNKTSKRSVKEEVKIEYELNCDNSNRDINRNTMDVCLRVGTNKLYTAKGSKLKNF